MKVLINQLNREDQIINLTGKKAKIIKDQPGYSPERGSKVLYALSKTKNGGVRLYKLVDKKWMDASLNDIADQSILDLFS